MSLLPMPAGVDVLHSAAVVAGVVDVVALLDEFRHFVDTDELRRVAREVWGVRPDAAPTSDRLDGYGDRVVDEFLNTVQDRWSGEAYEAFKTYVEDVRRALYKEADELPAIGQALMVLADNIELGWWDLVCEATAAVGLLLAAVGLLGTLAGTGAIILALAGYVVAVAGAAATQLAVVTPRVQLLQRQETELDKYGCAADSPIYSLPGITGESQGWAPRTADPYT